MESPEHTEETVKFPEGTKIVPIHPLAKYVISVPRDRLPDDEVEAAEIMKEFADVIDDWWNDGNPFMILTNDFTLVDIGKVDLMLDEENGEEEA